MTDPTATVNVVGLSISKDVCNFAEELSPQVSGSCVMLHVLKVMFCNVHEKGK